MIEELAGQRLTRLADMSAAKQKALTETFRVWLESWSTAAEVGGRLHVHPQTVRYRLNQLKESLGDSFTDPRRGSGWSSCCARCGCATARSRADEPGRSSKAS